MNTSPRVLVALVVLVIGSTVHAADPTPVAVTLRSGRTFKAAIDARTDGEKLWLRFDGPRSAWYRPVEWDAVVSARVGDRQLTADELRTSITDMTSTRGELAELPAPRPVEENAFLPPPDSFTMPRPLVVVNTPTPGVVASLQVDAQLANWDNDVEPDGLLVSILPLDGYGVPVLAAGTLEVELIGEAYGPVGQFSGYPNLGRYVFQVAPGDFGPHGATYRCPFQALDPEFNTFLGPRGLANVRFSVPGAGTFESTTSAVRMRLFNPIRDRLQIETGVRFFPNEWTGRGIGNW